MGFFSVRRRTFKTAFSVMWGAYDARLLNVPEHVRDQSIAAVKDAIKSYPVTLDDLTRYMWWANNWCRSNPQPVPGLFITALIVTIHDGSQNMVARIDLLRGRFEFWRDN